MENTQVIRVIFTTTKKEDILRKGDIENFPVKIPMQIIKFSDSELMVNILKK